MMYKALVQSVGIPSNTPTLFLDLTFRELCTNTYVYHAPILDCSIQLKVLYSFGWLIEHNLPFSAGLSIKLKNP